MSRARQRSTVRWQEGGSLDARNERLLLDALESYGLSTGLTEIEPVWRIERTLERRDSTVHEVKATLGPGVPANCYVKTFRVPPDRSHMEATLRNRVSRSGWLADHVAEKEGSLTFGVPSVLASDPDLLTIVSLAVRGLPLGKAWNHLLPTRLRAARSTFVSLGRAMRQIEEISSTVAEPSTYLDGDSIERATATVLPYLVDGGQQWAQETVDGLYRRNAKSSSRSYFCHGDINHSNVLIDDGRLNLIDFDLRSRPHTFDLSVFLLRLEFERPAITRMSDQVAGWVVEGYGVTDVREEPAFALTRLIKLSNSIASASRRGDQRKLRRYLSSLQGTLSRARGLSG